MKIILSSPRQNSICPQAHAECSIWEILFMSSLVLHMFYCMYIYIYMLNQIESSTQHGSCTLTQLAWFPSLASHPYFENMLVNLQDPLNLCHAHWLLCALPYACGTEQNGTILSLIIHGGCVDGVHLHEPSLAHAGIHSRCSEVNLVFVHYEIRQHTHLGKKIVTCVLFIWHDLAILEYS